MFQDEWVTIADKLGAAALDDMILATGEGPDLIPAHPGLDTLDAELGNIDDVQDRYTRLGHFFDEYIDPRGYRVILVDLPGLTNNISYNGLWASGNVIVPVEMGPYEADQASTLREDIDRIAANFPVAIELAMVMPNKVDTRTTLAEQYLNAFIEEYTEAIAPAHVPYSQDIRNATENGQTAFQLEYPSNTAKKAREAFIANARALIDRLGSKQDA